MPLPRAQGSEHELEKTKGHREKGRLSFRVHGLDCLENRHVQTHTTRLPVDTAKNDEYNSFLWIFMALYFLYFMVISYQLSAPPPPHPHPHPHSPSSSCICLTEGQPKQDQNGRLFRTKDPSGTCVEEGSAAAQVSI